MTIPERGRARATVAGSCWPLPLAMVVALGCSSVAPSARDQGEGAELQEEARAACVGLSGSELEPGLSGFTVVRVVRLVRPVRVGQVTAGAAASVALGDASFESVTRAVQCRAARARVSGDPLDPLGVPGSDVHTIRDGEVAIVQIHGRRVEVAREIVRRMREHLPGFDLAVGTDEGTDVGTGQSGTRRVPSLRPPRSIVTPPTTGPSPPTRFRMGHLLGVAQPAGVPSRTSSQRLAHCAAPHPLSDTQEPRSC
jgi:hypothetical protein